MNERGSIAMLDHLAADVVFFKRIIEIAIITGADMSRTLDLSALRAFVAIADSGGVTRAAASLHRTQSAVSMQVKRLEEALGTDLLDRSGRGVAPSAAGEQLLGYARRMLALNDEAWDRLTHGAYEGEITLGVPHDIVQPAIPQVLRRFAAGFPRMSLRLITANTSDLRARHGRGTVDVIVTTERAVGAGGEVLNRRTLRWVGAPGGRAQRERPLPIAFERDCIFRPDVTARLSAAGIAWRMVTDTASLRTVEAVVCADLAVHAVLDGSSLGGMTRLGAEAGLPVLEDWCIGLYVPPTSSAPADALVSLLRECYGPYALAA